MLPRRCTPQKCQSTLLFKWFIMCFFLNVYWIFCLWEILYWKFTFSIVTEFCFFKHMLLCGNVCEHPYRAKICVSWKHTLCHLLPNIFHQTFFFSVCDSSESDKLSVMLQKYSGYFAHDQYLLLYHVTDLACMHEEIKSKLYAGDTCYHLVQKL